MEKPNSQGSSNKTLIERIFFVLFGVGLITSMLILLRRFLFKKQPSQFIESKITQEAIQGLTGAEVESRKSEERIQARLVAEKKVRTINLKRRIFSVFNLTMLVLAITQAFLDDRWGALGTLGTLLLNIFITTFHQLRSAKQVEGLLSAIRPKANVIREGVLSSINQDDIVVGDVLIIGKGDEIFADGMILESSELKIDTTPFDYYESIIKPRTGDRLTTGHFCEAGWAIYRVEHISTKIDEVQLSSAATSISEIRTPLQKGIQIMLQVLLVISGIFYIILITEIFRLDYFPDELILIYRQAISIIFSIAPSGLLFIIVVNYAVGRGSIAKAGALVKNSPIIESLAQVTNLVIVRNKNLDSLTVEIDMLPDRDGNLLFSETRTRQLLGNYFQSVSSQTFPFSIIKDTFEGNQCQIKKEASFFSVLGWEAINFSSEDMLGTYVIGYPEILDPYIENHHLAEDDLSLFAKLSDQTNVPKRYIKSAWLRRWTKKDVQESIASGETGAQDELQSPAALSQLQRLRTRFNVRSKKQDDLETAGDREQSPGKVLRLLFAYSSDNLLAQSTSPQPPPELTPICYLNIVHAYSPELEMALRSLQNAGISLKVLSSGRLHNLDGLGKELNINDPEELKSQIVSGSRLPANSSLKDFEFLRSKTVFYELNNSQMMQVIQTLRKGGDYVALQSKAISDIPLMAQADINVTTQSSSNKVIYKSDAVLMNNLPTTVPAIFQMSQNIVQSVVNLLKINLTEIGYVLLLLIAMFLTKNREFVYQPVQGGVIGIFSITLPTFFISIWTYSLKSNREKIQKQLWMFSIPASVTITLAAVAVYFFFAWRGFIFPQTQYIITHLLVFIGLSLVVFCYPPHPNISPDGKYVSDWRMTIVAISLLVVFNLLTFIPLFQKYFRIYPLDSLLDYILIWGFGLGWALLTLFVWRVVWRRFS